MTDRGIIFSAPMVRALLAGQKSQTRRIIKVPGIMGGRYPIYPPEEAIELEDGEFAAGVFHYLSTAALSGTYRLPAAVDDRLWVRENARRGGWDPGGDYDWMSVGYEADGSFISCRVAQTGHAGPYKDPRKVVPYIHMPRWASRMTLIVEAVRVEPLQAISVDDAIAEGVLETNFYERAEHKVAGGAPWSAERLAYADLWSSLHGTDCWAANPAVVAITFRVERRNIDADPERAAA